MLVLQRHREEWIVITDKVTGERIELVVVDVRCGKVRLGFEASKRFEIHRLEVQESVDRERAEGR